MHYYNGENQIISNEFYLSDSRLPSDEKKEFINMIDSNEGELVACNFPARYTFLKKEYNLPNFNLKNCEPLEKFIESFPKDEISIVFSSEYTNNPSSAFGHTLLLFTQEGESKDLGDVIHFAAKTPNDGFFKYSYNGMTGKYKGYFIKEPFFKKVYEYNTLEQRFMHIYTLDLSNDEIMFILYHLYELRKATFKYYFLDGNCASQTTDLLNIVLDKNRDLSQIYYLPIDVVQENQNLIKAKEVYIPLLSKLDIQFKQMSYKEKELFLKQTFDYNSSYEMSDLVKESLVDLTIFNFRKLRKIHKNYDEIMKLEYIPNEISNKENEPLDSAKPSNLEIGYFYNGNKFLNIGYRPLFIDFFDIQNNKMQESTVKTFSWNLNINNETVILNNFDLINIQSFVITKKYYRPLSWKINSGLNKDNKDKVIKFNNEIGLGKTYSIVDNINTTLLLNFGLDNIDLYIKPQVTLHSYFNDWIKVGINSSYKQYKNNNYFNNNIFTSIRSDNLLYNLEYKRDNSKTNNDSVLLTFKYNF